MKLIVSSFLFLALCPLLLAADPVVVVNSATSISVDGKESGKPIDTMRNRPELTSSIQSALEKWDAERTAALARQQADLDKARADADTKSEHALKVIRAKKAKEEATGKGKAWTALDELEGELNLTADDIREAELDAQIEKLKAQKKKK